MTDHAEAARASVDRDIAVPLRTGREDSALLAQLSMIVGRKHVLSGAAQTRAFAHGYRFGSGPVFAVVRPGSLVQLWEVLRLCVEAGKIVIPQAANTGLTGGSTPDGAYDRDVVLINTMRIAGIHPILGGTQVVCLPGATLDALERRLAPLGREPHSVIGSSCLGASVTGGICNNSGGALVQRGPAFTQFALYARLGADRQLHLVNHLGIRLGEDPLAILERAERGGFADEDVVSPDDRAASDPVYGDHVRAIDADTPARFNADPRRLFGAAGSAGKIMLFAVRLDTFPRESETVTFYIGTNDAAELGALRRDILSTFATLPIAAEYMHRDAYDLAERYGKDTFLAIRWLGTRRLRTLFAWKNRVDALASRLPILPEKFSDRVLQSVSRLFPRHLPPRMQAYRRRFVHYLILKVGHASIAETRRCLAARYPSPNSDYFECSTEEANCAFLHRFAAAGAAVRYRDVHPDEVEEIVALDIALRRNDRDWSEALPAGIESKLIRTLYYGHFLCHVFHQDYLVAKGEDPLALEHRLWELLDARGAEYPAEHNVGHLYPAKPALAAHYRALDPCNAFNPGIGQTSRERDWAGR